MKHGGGFVLSYPCAMRCSRPALVLLPVLCLTMPAQQKGKYPPPTPLALPRPDEALRDGSFARIGSVVVARNGELVYDRYVDGDAQFLRDTRSATKSITDQQTEKLLTDYILSALQP